MREGKLASFYLQDEKQMHAVLAFVKSLREESKA
jgi:hypothetical protein